MNYLFIDTNVLLSFFAFTDDDLTRLERLADEVKQGHVTVFMTKQVDDEFRRNREGKIYAATKELRGQRALSLMLPRLCDPYPEADRLKLLAKDYAQLHRALVGKIDADTRARSLRADFAVEKLRSCATYLNVGDEILRLAQDRVDRGNPPGKRVSLGDAMNWQALLAESPRGPLYVVTDDKDFYSDFDASQAREFLIHEWNEIASQPIAFVRRLSDLPPIVAPEAIPVNDDQDARDDLVAALRASPNFATTHAVIGGLSSLGNFTASQVHGLLAALENSQVDLILGDSDVFAFYAKLLAGHDANFNAEQRDMLRTRLAESAPDEGDDALL